MSCSMEVVNWMEQCYREEEHRDLTGSAICNDLLEMVGKNVEEIRYRKKQEALHKELREDFHDLVKYFMDKHWERDAYLDDPDVRDGRPKFDDQNFSFVKVLGTYGEYYSMGGTGGVIWDDLFIGWGYQHLSPHSLDLTAEHPIDRDP